MGKKSKTGSVSSSTAKGATTKGKTRADESAAKGGKPVGGLSAPQLTALVSLTIALTNIMDLSRAVNIGASSTFCNDYFLYENDNKCTSSDVFFIMNRYHSSLLRIGISLAAVVLSWRSDPLLQTHNVFYAVSPVMTNLVALVMVRTVFSARDLFSGVALLILIYTSNKVGWAKPGKIYLLRLCDAVLLTVWMGVLMSTAYYLGKGPQEICTFDDVTIGGSILWKLTAAVDYSSILGMITFALFFFSEGNKRVMLMVLAIAALVHVFRQLPKQAEYLRSPETQHNVLLGSAIIMFISAFVPSFSLKIN